MESTCINLDLFSLISKISLCHFDEAMGYYWKC
jgi:hypothetical protein